MTTLTHRLGERIRLTMAHHRARREHDRAMSDPQIRDEHYAARARDTAAGAADCYFCA